MHFCWHLDGFFCAASTVVKAGAWLRAGGSLVIATWCQREETPEASFSEADRAALQFLYDEWAHPYFVSVQEYGRLLQACAQSRCWPALDLDSNLSAWPHSLCSPTAL